MNSSPSQTTLAVIGALATAVALTLSGCSPEVPESREASILGTRICVINGSSMRPTVAFTLKDSAQNEGVLSRGDQACGEGKQDLGHDVEGTISVAAPGRSVDFYGWNHFIGAPGATIDMNGRYCTGAYNVDFDTRYVWDDGLLRFSILRLPDDDDWKEFTITVEDTMVPSADGKAAECPDHGDPGTE